MDCRLGCQERRHMRRLHQECKQYPSRVEVYLTFPMAASMVSYRQIESFSV